MKHSVKDVIFNAADYKELRESLDTDNILLTDDSVMSIENIESENGRRYIQTNGGRYNERTILAYSFIEVGDVSKAIKNEGDEVLECVNTRDDKNLVRVIDWLEENIGSQFRLPSEMTVSKRLTRGADKHFMENETRKHVYKGEEIYDRVKEDDSISHVPVFRKDMGGNWTKSPVLVFKPLSEETIKELRVEATEEVAEEAA